MGLELVTVDESCYSLSMLYYEPLTCQVKATCGLSQFRMAVYNHSLIIKIVYIMEAIISCRLSRGCHPMFCTI